MTNIIGAGIFAATMVMLYLSSALDRAPVGQNAFARSSTMRSAS
jgi:hypothetical protein